MDRDLVLGIVASTRKPDERRLALHPAHLERVDADIRGRMVLEEGYGARFGYRDEQLAPLVAGLRPRDELVAESDVVVIPKPVTEDLEAMTAGQVLWGWPHCVQDRALTQAAIDRRLTLIAFEAMNHWTAEGEYDLHVFHKNNELAGYASVLHALELTGSTGAYGRRLRAIVISFGATARGAVTGLTALGVGDVTVVTQREVSAVASPVPSAELRRFGPDPDAPGRTLALDATGPRPLAELLAEHDVVVNCILQDPEAPLMFAAEADLGRFERGTLFVDVSCDEGMGFEWTRPTSFADPMYEVGDGLRHYAVDHSPSHLWNSATWENSEAIMRYLPIVAAGPGAWAGDETIRRAIEIRDGVIQNPRIASFQGRSAAYPHDPA